MTCIYMYMYAQQKSSVLYIGPFSTNFMLSLCMLRKFLQELQMKIAEFSWNYLKRITPFKKTPTTKKSIAFIQSP